jgi:protein-disulfide isomerase
MDTTSNTKRFFTWGSFIIVVGLIIWGLIAAEQKAKREEAKLILPDQIVATDHVKGSENAPVTLVEYGDFQCPACATYYPVVERVLAEEGGDKIRFVFRHFPLSQHANAMSAGMASEAAGAQGKFWEMYSMLYEKQKDWENAKDSKIIFMKYAEDLKLDMVKFSEDFESQDFKNRINNDYKGGAKAGVNSTPTFFVNGKKINSGASYDELKKIINDAVPKISL